jgi:serine/threonine protein kinase
VDWYNLGALIYEMLTGKPPFLCLDHSEMINLIKFSKPQFPDYLSSSAVDLLSNLLVKNPEKRMKFILSSKFKNHSWFKNIGFKTFIVTFRLGTVDAEKRFYAKN